MIEIPDIVRELVVKPLTRSSGWSRARREHLKKHPECAICGTLKKPSVHHRIPFKEDHTLELEPTNFITLCRKFKHHYTFGHLMSWRRYNPDLDNTVNLFNLLIDNAKKIDGDLST